MVCKCWCRASDIPKIGKRNKLIGAANSRGFRGLTYEEAEHYHEFSSSIGKLPSTIQSESLLVRVALLECK
jgi:hypothetical protein